MNNKIIVGVVPIVNKSLKSPFLNYYKYLNTYINQVRDNDAIPICLNYYNNDIIIDQLKLCDCIILPGNCIIRPQVYKVIKYAYENNIPVLGICLGMQELAVFSYLNESNNPKKIEKNIIYKLDNKTHHPVKGSFNNLDAALHEININKDSFIYSCYKKEKILVYSFHNYAVKSINSSFKTTAYALDAVIEAIESTSDWLSIGVQFHPELEQDNLLIKCFLDKVRVAKKP